MDYSYMKAKEVKKKPYSYEKDKAKEGKRKPYSYEKDLAREAKKTMKKSPVALIIILVMLVVGLVGGFFAHKYAFASDTFQMNAYSTGEIDICIGADEKYQTYTELGVTCVNFGKDVSKECTVKYYFRADMTADQVEVTKVDEKIPGMYYAVYSTTSSKYKTVTLIRNIVVLGEED